MKRIVLCLVALLGFGAMALAAKENKALIKVQHQLAEALAKLALLEPHREGVTYDSLRGNVVLINLLTPAVEFTNPTDGAVLPADEDIVIEVDITNWLVDPAKAVNAGTQFANGHQEYQTGHTHIWIYDVLTGARVRFTGANGLLPTGDGGSHQSAAFQLPPGYYKAYVSLQNHDHTLATQSSAQALLAVDAVAFSVAAASSAPLGAKLPSRTVVMAQLDFRKYQDCCRDVVEDAVNGTGRRPRTPRVPLAAKD